MDPTADNLTAIESRVTALETAIGQKADALVVRVERIEQTISADAKAAAAAAEQKLHQRFDQVITAAENLAKVAEAKGAAAEAAVKAHLSSPRAAMIALLAGVILGALGFAIGEARLAPRVEAAAVTLPVPAK